VLSRNKTARLTASDVSIGVRNGIKNLTADESQVSVEVADVSNVAADDIEISMSSVGDGVRYVSFEYGISESKCGFILSVESGSKSVLRLVARQFWGLSYRIEIEMLLCCSCQNDTMTGFLFSSSQPCII
jgi:hypothetical protein